MPWWSKTVQQKAVSITKACASHHPSRISDSVLVPDPKMNNITTPKMLPSLSLKIITDLDNEEVNKEINHTEVGTPDDLMDGGIQGWEECTVWCKEVWLMAVYLTPWCHGECGTKVWWTFFDWLGGLSPYLVIRCPSAKSIVTLNL